MRLARDEADIVVTDIDAKSVQKVSEEVRGFGVKSLGMFADISNKSSVEEMVSRVVKEWKRIDVLVNCAGIAPLTPLIEITEEEFDAAFKVNLKGVLLCTQAVAKEMIKTGAGKIINISSIAGKRGDALIGSYAATKFGVVGLTQVTAIELAKYGITCNAIAPGPIDTRLWKARDRREAEVRGKEKIDSLQRAVKGIPLGRAGKTEDVANVVSFLAGSDSDFINGQTINVCGGVIFN